jgi:hypothetical protein
MDVSNEKCTVRKKEKLFVKDRVFSANSGGA